MNAGICFLTGKIHFPLVVLTAFIAQDIFPYALTLYVGWISASVLFAINNHLTIRGS